MNEATYRTCQELVRDLREWEIESGYGWPGKAVNASAETLYPNLVTELGWTCPWLYLMAEFADVSKEIMAAALEDNEELSGLELWRLAQYLHVSVGYLTAPVISFVDPATNKGKARRRALADLLKQAAGLDFWQWRVEFVLSLLNSGKAVTYASYRWAVKKLTDAIASNQREQHKPRTERRAKTHEDH